MSLWQYQEAIENCDLAIKYDPSYIGSYLEKGIALRKLGKYKEAINLYDLAIKYKPDYAEIYLEKVITFISMQQQKAAKENFNLALKYKPNLITEYEAIIKALRTIGNNLMADYLEEKLQILKNNI